MQSCSRGGRRREPSPAGNRRDVSSAVVVAADACVVRPSSMMASGVAELAVELIDTPIVVMSAGLRAQLLINAAARRLIGEQLPGHLLDAASTYVAVRGAATRPPPLRVSLGPERAVYLRVLA